MASIRVLKSRIRSVKNTKQITKAMQLVSASKMRRAQDADKASAPYTNIAREILTYLASQGVTAQSSLFRQRDIKKRLIIVIAADKGLAGAYNSNIFRTFARELNQDAISGVGNTTITVGRRAGQFAAKLNDANIVAAYDNVPDHPANSTFSGIFTVVKDAFLSGEVDAVDMVYTHFINSIKQEVRVERLFPAGFSEIEVSDSVREAKYEPGLEEVLEAVTKRLIKAQIFQALLDAKASEHSMRMVAMKNATDNASGLADDLTLVMNKARQGAITQELAEISGGVEALKD
jgi:F-type H+-transporting ATPase subunit gamma